ncbi:PREDICTED: uncharacterized protein LOC108559202 [Nicrophorus vespilloides]|uniref:Uncharacterized protein LOC108559202 n=1 Tax=Nicrophorus vespilloides TaxID=110193 RepID=A0ABM1MBC5_NICVS|nr:PREDICTED: uncharacterized protein LOC108559202 [Nicrophorus vespilloides]
MGIQKTIILFALVACISSFPYESKQVDNEQVLIEKKVIENETEASIVAEEDVHKIHNDKDVSEVKEDGSVETKFAVTEMTIQKIDEIAVNVVSDVNQIDVQVEEHTTEQAVAVQKFDQENIQKMNTVEDKVDHKSSESECSDDSSEEHHFHHHKHDHY